MIPCLEAYRLPPMANTAKAVSPIFPLFVTRALNPKEIGLLITFCLVRNVRSRLRGNLAQNRKVIDLWCFWGNGSKTSSHLIPQNISEITKITNTYIQ